jgi:hypothetical protein
VLANQHLGQLAGPTREELASNARMRVVFLSGFNPASRVPAILPGSSTHGSRSGFYATSSRTNWRSGCSRPDTRGRPLIGRTPARGRRPRRRPLRAAHRQCSWSDAAGHAMWLKSRSGPGGAGSDSTTAVQRRHCDALSAGVRCGVRCGARCGASYGAGPRNSEPSSTCVRTLL